MAQRVMTQAEYIAWTDILGSAIDVLLTAKGVEATPATAAKYCADLRDAITALADPDEADITVDLLPSAVALVTRMELESDLASLFAAWNSAVLSHLGNTNLNTWLTSGGLRVHHFWRRSGNVGILPVNVFPPITVMGTVAVTGGGACTWTEDPTTEGEVDTSMYADAQLEVEVINQPTGVAEATFTVVGTNFLGGAESHTAVVPAESPAGTKVDVGLATDLYATVTGVTVAGGTNGDDIQVQTKEDR